MAVTNLLNHDLDEIIKDLEAYGYEYDKIIIEKLKELATLRWWFFDWSLNEAKKEVEKAVSKSSRKKDK